MSKNHRRVQRYHEPTKREWQKTYGVRWTLKELFEPHDGTTLEERLLPLVQVARWRIIGVFNGEREYHKRSKCLIRECDHADPALCIRKRYSTDNYIARPSDKLSSLLHYVQSCIHHAFVHPHHLAPRFHHFPPDALRQICKIAEEQLLVAALLQMAAPRNSELWYDHGNGVWQIAQSCAEEPKLAHKLARSTANAVNGWYDNRTYHGRNGNQARRRDKRNGNAYRSTGFSGQVT